MDRVHRQSMAESLAQPAAPKPARLFFIDHLRAALVILVVLHHLAVVYGEGVSFYYVDPPSQDSLTYLALIVFVLANQAWFMGAFFLLAGYFTPGSYDRKGPVSFLKDRLVRLGIPLVLFYFVLNPISGIGYYLEPAPRIPEPLTWQSFSRAYPELIGLGPLWFVALLLIFSVGYAAWRLPTRNRAAPLSAASGSSLPSYRAIGGFVLALALVTYLIRTVIPIGRVVLDFPTLSYLPQYLSFFVLGAVAARQDWFPALSRSMGVRGLAVAAAAFVLLFPLAFFSGLDGQFLGNGHWQSAVYALWDSIFAVGMILALIPLFHRYFNGQGRLGRLLAQNSYAVYIIHTPIIVLLAIALAAVDLDNFLKFVMLAVIVVPICFAAAYAIRKLPLAPRVL